MWLLLQWRLKIQIKRKIFCVIFSLMVEITVLSSEIYQYWTYLYLIVSWISVFFSFYCWESKWPPVYLWASKYLGHCLAYTWHGQDFFFFKCVHSLYNYLGYSLNQVSGAGNRQCVTVNKIGSASEFTWLHSSEVGIW